MIFNSTSRARVQDAERLWIPKFVLRILTILVAILSIGCLAWAFAQDGASYLEYLANTGDDGNDNFSYVSQDRYLLPWQFIPLGVSIIWNLTNVLVRLSRPRPMHPGANVGVDLLLWLSFVVTGLFAMVAVVDNLNSSAAYSISNNTGSEGSQEVEYANGTYGYENGSYGYFNNGIYGFIPDTYESDPCPGFTSCDAKHTLLGKVTHVGVVEAIGCAFGFVALLLHFTLFVWACVDTHHRNNGKVDRRAQAIAQTLIAEMAERGVLPANANTHTGQRQQQAPLLAPDGTPMGEISREMSSDPVGTAQNYEWRQEIGGELGEDSRNTDYMDGERNSLEQTPVLPERRDLMGEARRGGMRMHRTDGVGDEITSVPTGRGNAS